MSEALNDRLTCSEMQRVAATITMCRLNSVVQGKWPCFPSTPSSLNRHLRGLPQAWDRPPPEDFLPRLFSPPLSRPARSPHPALIPALRLTLLLLTDYLPGRVRRLLSKLSPSRRPRVSTGPRHPKQEKGRMDAHPGKNTFCDGSAPSP